MSNPITAITSSIISTFLTEHDYSTNTHATYTYGIQRFIAYSIPVDPNCLNAFAVALREDPHHYSANTRETAIAAVKQLLQWLDADDMLPFSYSKAALKLKTARGHHTNRYKPRLIDPNMRAMLTHLDQSPELCTRNRQTYTEHLRDRAIIHVLFSTAMRRSECAELTRQLVRNGSAAEIVIRGKGDKYRTVFLNPESRIAITNYLAHRADRNPALFISHRFAAGHQLTGHGIYSVVTRAARNANLDPHTSPHSIRHYVASDMRRRGVALEVVQHYLGHSDIKTTETIYAHIHDDTIRDAWQHYTRLVRSEDVLEDQGSA
jgi:site-specific recombinase XerD